MGSTEEFESLLKEVVSGKRLSASKMSKLTDITMKSMEYDTQLVSTLYRTHKSLSPPGKVSSLYVFDALSRAARHQVNKQGLTGDLHSAHGNCATFLLKVEGVLDGLFQDMVPSGHPESKEKMKKILDIWAKANTFPSSVLARLSNVVKGSEEKDIGKVAPIPSQSTDPRHQPTPTVKTLPQAIPPQPPVAPSSVQSTLLALLNQAANAVATVNGQTTPNIATLTSAPAPHLDANQLALFQQLTQTAKAGGAVPTQPVTVPVSLVPSSATANVPPVAPPVGGPSQPLPYRDDHFDPGRRDPKYDRFDGPERGRDRDEYHDERRDFRGEHRGGHRGRGRGRGRWDDRDRYKDNRERDWNAAQRNRRSRSRSPPRNRFGGGRREVRPYSPPRRPILAQTSGSPSQRDGPPSSVDSGKDEFGRDLRPQSPEESTPPFQSHTAAAQSPPTPISVPGLLPEDTEKASQDSRQIISSIPQASTDVIPRMDTKAHSTESNPGLDAFDMTSFNPTEPSSWEALGKAWTVSQGTMPSQEELMQYVMSGGVMGVYPPSMAGQYDVEQGGQWGGGQDQDWESSPQWNERGRGRGGTHRGNGRGGNWGYSGGRGYGQHETDAITLGGGDDQESYDSAYGEGSSWQDPSTQNGNASYQQDQGGQSESVGSAGGGRAGRMQRVGDKWVFVRADATIASEAT